MIEIDQMKIYRNRWWEVAAIEQREANNSSIDLRWNRLRAPCHD
jgi:hypothetical protein